VWSPAGGWWTLDPHGWQRNTAIAFAGIATIGYGIFSVSASKEVRLPRTGRVTWLAGWLCTLPTDTRPTD
jgi:hypothetical protein